jgi:Bacterial EndoU nuclease
MVQQDTAGSGTMSSRVRIATIVGLLVWACSPASAFFELSGVFIPNERCQAVDSIRRQTNPGNVLTVPGQSYNVRGLNKEDGDFVQVDVPGAVPGTRWVDLICGDLFRRDEPGDPDEPGPAFAPFFDTNDEPNDPSPQPPTLSAFDRAMLKVCGEWGSRPRQAAFRAALDNASLAADVTRIHQALGGSILGPQRRLKQFKDELASVWFAEDGFRHVFCGEPSERTIGGLHFVGRYLEMQEKGWGGLAAHCNKTEIEPPIYTFGVTFRAPSGNVATACPKGYALNLDAVGLLIEATQAFKLMLPRTSGKAMCLHAVGGASANPYLAVFVIKSAAVRTFYPDASPTCDRGRPADNCLCAP